jgi:hypothetical protein
MRRKRARRRRFEQERHERRSQLEPMIDYKYPTIALGATPIGSAGRAPDEELLREEQGRKFRVHYRWQAPKKQTRHLLPSGEWIQEPDNFGHCI